MEEIFEFLKKCGVFYLATIDGNKPRVRPFGAVNFFEDKIYIQTAKSKNVSKQMQANPNIEICGFIENSWVRIEAEVERDDRFEAKQSMLDANPMLKNMYSAEDDNTEVLFLKNGKATFYSFSSGARVVEF